MASCQTSLGSHAIAMASGGRKFEDVKVDSATALIAEGKYSQGESRELLSLSSFTGRLRSFVVGGGFTPSCQKGFHQKGISEGRPGGRETTIGSLVYETIDLEKGGHLSGMGRGP